MNSTDFQAVMWALAGSSLFSVVYASGKMAGPEFSAMQILFLRYVGGFAAMLLVVLASRRSIRHCASPKPLSHLARALFGATGGSAIIHASAHMPIMDATAIGLLSIVFMVILGVVLLREKLRGKHWFGLCGCTAGAAVIVLSQGAFGAFESNYLWPAAVALTGAVLIALEGILIRTLSMAERPLGILLHVNFFGMLLMAAPALYFWHPGSLVDLIPFVLLGPLAITAQYFVIRGYAIADIAVVGPIDFSWLAFAALIGFVMFGEIPTVWVLMGSFLIAAGGIVLAGAPRAQN